jgi:hypothetical protein
MPAAGEKYRLTASSGFGNAGDVGFIRPGTLLTVRELVDADTPGAGDEDCVVVEIDAHSVDYDDDGNPQVVTFQRAVSFALDQFDSLTEKVSD